MNWLVGAVLLLVVALVFDLGLLSLKFLNLGDVPYVDSAGIGEIVGTYTTLSRVGGTLRLLNLTKRIHDLLAITNFGSKSLEEVLQKLDERGLSLRAKE